MVPALNRLNLCTNGRMGRVSQSTAVRGSASMLICSVGITKRIRQRSGNPMKNIWRLQRANTAAVSV